MRFASARGLSQMLLVYPTPLRYCTIKAQTISNVIPFCDESQSFCLQGARSCTHRAYVGERCLLAQWGWLVQELPGGSCHRVALRSWTVGFSEVASMVFALCILPFGPILWWGLYLACLGTGTQLRLASLPPFVRPC